MRSALNPITQWVKRETFNITQWRWVYQFWVKRDKKMNNCKRIKVNQMPLLSRWYTRSGGWLLCLSPTLEMPQKEQDFEWIGIIKMKTTRTPWGRSGQAECRRVGSHSQRIVFQQIFELKPRSLLCCCSWITRSNNPAEWAQCCGGWVGR